MIKIAGLHTAVPPLSLTQEQSLKFILKNFKTSPACRNLYKKVLTHKGIAKRHFVFDKIEDVLEKDPDKINHRFEEKALKLSAQSILGALVKAKIKPEELDFLAVSTCTGYLCPGLSAQLIGKCDLRKDVRTLDVVGMGCGSALPAMEQCHNFLHAYPKAVAAFVSTEICSSAIFVDDSADLVISNGIFADGSASLVLKNMEEPGVAELCMFHSLTYPEWKETLRFKTEMGRLRNVLGKDVPQQAGQSVEAVVKQCLLKMGLKKSDVAHWILHSGGSKVLDQIQKVLRLTDKEVFPSREILKNFGNISSPTVLYVLNEILNSSLPPKPNDFGLMVAFGAGFSVHGCVIRF